MMAAHLPRAFGAKRRALPAVALVAALGLNAGCAGQAARRLALPRPDPASLVWPQPPASPKIRFVQDIAHPQALGAHRALLRRLGDLLFGAEEARFVRPTGVAVEGTTLYVADPGARSLWLVDQQACRYRRIQRAGARKLVSPVAVAIGREGRVYLADSFLKQVLLYRADGRYLSVMPDPGFQRPSGLAYDPGRDRLYVADSAAHRIWVSTGEGVPLSVIGRRGTGEGEFNFPTHVTVGAQGRLYVTDALGFRVQAFTPEGAFVSRYGWHGDTAGHLAMPKGIAIDRDDHLYVVDALFDAVQVFDPEGRLLLAFGERGSGPGQFWLPGGLFIDAKNRIYIADAYNQRVQVFEYLGDPSGS
jgi:sugar lactone lactonase YvrE